MKRYLSYCTAIFAMFLASCVNLTEGLNEADILVVSTKNIEMDNAGGESTIEVDAYCSWKVSSTEDWSWITTTATKGEKGKSQFKLVLSENFTVEDRTATITIENKTYEVTHEIAVLQKAGSPYVKFSKDIIEATSDGLEDKLVVESNVDYTISSTEDWCHLSTSKGESGQMELNITIDPSPSTTMRTATLIFKNAEKNFESTLTVNQRPFQPSLEVSDSLIESMDLGLEKEITITSNIAWAATCEANWVTLSSVNGEKGTSTLTVNIQKNAGVSARDTKIVVSNSEYELVKEITITQLPIIPTIEASETSIASTEEGRSANFTVTSNIPWTVSCSETWITLTPANGMAGTNTVQVTIDRNATTSVRNATIQVTNSEYGITKEIAVSQLAFGPQIEVSESSIASTEEGRFTNFTVTSNIPWTVSRSETWITLTPANGMAGTNTVQVTIDRNATTSVRNATIQVTNSEYGITKEVAVNQLAFGPGLEVSESQLNATCEGLSKDITVTSNIAWSAACEANWITLSTVNGNSGNTTITATVAGNQTTTARTAVIYVRNNDYNLTREITVSQEAFNPVLTISDSQISATCESMSKDITVTSNIAWSAACEANWITLSTVNSNNGNSTVAVTVAQNNTTSARTAVISIRNNDYNITREITVSQEAFNPVLTVSDSQINATETGMQKNLTITANIPWNAVCEASWITLSAANGVGSDSEFIVTVANNPTSSARNATISVSNTEYGISHNITVSQSEFTATLAVSNSSLTFNSTSETKDVTVEANLPWTATCNADWISLSPVNGNGTEGLTTLSITTTTNFLTSAREAVVVVSNSENNITREIAVSQSAFTPELSIVGENSITLDFMEGTRTVSIRANINYTATSNADWLDIEQVTDGIRLVYSTNLESASSREAEVTISTSEYDNLGCVLTVTQVGYNETYTIHYTSTGGLIMPASADFGANIIAVTCDGGQGLIRFDGPVTRIGDNAFSNSTELTSIILPTGVLSIGSNAFLGCTALENVEFNSDITSIGNGAFGGCTSLTEINLPEGLTTIGESTFYNCTSLATVNIPSGVTSIGSSAFRGCSALTSASIPSSVNTIGEYAFAECSTIESVSIPSSVSSIGSNAFYNCSSLNSVTLPSGLTSIGAYTFYGCSSLGSIEIPAEVTSIGSYALSGCSSLEILRIPSSVTSIGEYAFSNCSSLRTVVCTRSAVPTGSTRMFNNHSSSLRIYVPTGCSNNYKNASYWSTYSSYIYDIEYTPTECTSLTITAEDVRADATNTIITYTAVTNGTTPFGTLSGIEVTGRVQSESFPANTSKEDVEVTVSFTYMGVSASTTITQRGDRGTYTVSLNSQWRHSTTVPNPDTSLYDGVYESYSNYHVNGSTATMYIDIDGYETFEVYIRSNGESSFDYVRISALDSTTEKASTYGRPSSTTSISGYTKVTYTGIDRGAHRITVTYSKDSSVHNNDDRGYVLIPKNQ